MTATGDAPSQLERAPDAARPDPDPPPELVHQVCPYLQGAGGGWRSLQPTRDHRCTATQPAAEPAVGKQRDLCLTAAHDTCATYLAARDLEHGEVPDPRVEAGLWPTTQQSVLALEPARAAVRSVPRGATRVAGQALLAGLIVVAFVVLVVARSAPSGASGPGASAAVVAASDRIGSPVPSAAPATTGPSASPTPAPSSPAPSATPAATAAPTASAGASTPAPPEARTAYTVKRGDTLSSIAAEHGVTVRQLRRANDLTGNLIRPGQELVIPAP